MPVDIREHLLVTYEKDMAEFEGRIERMPDDWPCKAFYTMKLIINNSSDPSFNERAQIFNERAQIVMNFTSMIRKNK